MLTHIINEIAVPCDQFITAPVAFHAISFPSILHKSCQSICFNPPSIAVAATTAAVVVEAAAASSNGPKEEIEISLSNLSCKKFN